MPKIQLGTLSTRGLGSNQMLTHTVSGHLQMLPKAWEHGEHHVLPLSVTNRDELTVTMPTVTYCGQL